MGDGEVENKVESNHRGRLTEFQLTGFLGAVARRAETLLNRSAAEFAKFCVVGLSGVVVNIGFYLLLTRTLSISMHLASPVAIEASLLWNFALHDNWTFSRRRTQAGFLPRLGRFHAVCALGGVINYLVLVLMVKLFGWWDIYANLLGIALGVAIKYAVNSAWTWQEPNVFRR